MKDQVYDTDVLMKELWVNLARDFRALTYPEFCQRQEQALRSDIVEFRDIAFPDKFTAPKLIFKAQYQLESLFKRYRFKNDKFSEQQLQDLTIQKFLDTQVRIAEPIIRTELIHRTVTGARRIIKSILGDFSESELQDRCRFGKKATLGNPFHKSYADLKLCSGKITGSTEHIKWFKNCLDSDRILESFLGKSNPSGEISYEICDTLKASLVPKSYKALRVILPNTLIGSYRTSGLGKMIEVRLKRAGLNVKNLQSKHGKLVKKMSQDRLSVTADLSSASDSPTVSLMKMLLPRPWFNELNLGRPKFVMINKQKVYLTSFMTMGIGYTFALETLIFYALLKSIARCARIKGRISVYGDDLIYPKQLHKYVAKIFPAMHLQLNKDKTYVSSYFRESCGADCYHGTDVRPFNPEGQHSSMDRKLYVCFLYKIINGLQHRWDILEIPGTIKFLLAEILLVDDFITQVPPTFPAISGYRVSYPIFGDISYTPIRRCKHTFAFLFPYYRLESRSRIILNEIPYYWESLRLATLRSEQQEAENPYHLEIFGPGFKLDRYTSLIDTAIWVRQQPQPKNYRSYCSHKRIKKMLRAEPSKIDSTVKRCKGRTSVWLE